MKVAIGNTIETSYLLISRGEKNSRVVSLARCQRGQCIDEYTRRMRQNPSSWDRIHHQMMIDRSQMVRTSSLPMIMDERSNVVYVNGVGLSIFTKNMARNEYRSFRFSQRIAAQRQVTQQRVQQVPRQQFVENVHRVGENLDRAVQIIQNTSSGSVPRSIFTSQSGSIISNTNVGDSRWDLDFEDVKKKTRNKIEKSLRWDLDWD